MASEVKQTIKTLYQNYHKALSEKQATFNLSNFYIMFVFNAKLITFSLEKSYINYL
ncbi:hypothetical protein 110_00139 [Staphylococcus phage 110]|uniref:Uncharacterized protein n=2 Tax=Sepunavirus TaxID=1980928 RepID=W5R9I9_9CAUD|nr:hypothetical protein FDH45_gp132 [Staphylococcus phage phiIBB-SEP1]AGR48260.1 hypothetical protein SEP1_134A [Staphylococcus phage phiIBB-SEP1]AXY83887.1 hypothetical protein Terranova_004 [Staphylococcus phage Terranova]QLF87128.1 hypothetical protein BESEP5_00186 [Staphylococcus phage vB_SepM_BE05]WJJ58303.1 hypothetical protein 110_00140 [Staphylococcus phage 110]